PHADVAGSRSGLADGSERRLDRRSDLELLRPRLGGLIRDSEDPPTQGIGRRGKQSAAVCKPKTALDQRLQVFGLQASEYWPQHLTDQIQAGVELGRSAGLTFHRRELIRSEEHTSELQSRENL